MTDPFPWEDAPATALPPDAYDVRDPAHPDNRPAADDLEGTTAVVSFRLAEAARMLDDYRDEATRRGVVGDAKRELLSVVRRRADDRRTARLERLGGEEPTSPGDVRRELVGAADDADVLTDLAAVFTAGAAEAKGIAGDLLDELPKRNTAKGPKPPSSVKAGDGQGFQLTLTRTVRTDLSVDLDEVVEVVVSSEIARYVALAGNDHDGDDVATYAAGLRAGVATLRTLLSASPGFKSTALDALATRLENAGEDDLAKRLGRAYGKVEKGEPTVKIDRKPIEVDA